MIAYFFVILVKITLLLGFAIILDALLRSRPLVAGAMWNFVLLSIPLLPIAAISLPSLGIPLIPLAAISQREQSTKPIVLNQNTSANSPAYVTTGPELSAIGTAAANQVQSSPRPTTNHRTFLLSPAFICGMLGSAYALGVLIAIGRLVISAKAVRSLLRNATLVHDEMWLARFEHWSNSLGLAPVGQNQQTESIWKRRVTLFEGPVDGPLATGLFHGVVVVPSTMIPSQHHSSCDAILVHELAHVARCDSFWQLLQRLIEAALWFHPLMWITAGRMSFVRERACDEFSLHCTGDFEKYATTLIDIAAALTPKRDWNLASSMVRVSRLDLRLRALETSNGSPECVLHRGKRTFVGMTTFSCTLLLAGLSLTSSLGNNTDGREISVSEQTNQESESEKNKDAQGKAIAPAKPEVKELLDRIDGALRAVESYDVYVTSTMTYPMKIIIVDSNHPDQPGITKEWKSVPRDPGEPTESRMQSFRFVKSKEGKRRIETQENQQTFLRVDDGQVERMLSIDSKQGSLSRSKMLRNDAIDYQTYVYAMPISLMHQLGLLEPDATTPDWVGIELPATTLGSLTYRIWYDPALNYAPRKMECWWHYGADNALSLLTRWVVNEYHQPQPGIWVPIDIRKTAHEQDPGPSFGAVLNDYRILVDVKRSRWNEPTDDDLFILRYPAGIHILDQLENLTFTTGKGDDGKDLELLRKHAKDKFSNNIPKRLDLSKVRIQDRKAAEILDKYRAILDVDKQGAITSISFSVSPAAIPGLTTPIIDDSVLKHLTSLDKLERLSLDHTNITNDGLKQLAGLKNLKTLTLACTNITDDGLKHLAPLTNLERLYLQNNLMDESGKHVVFVKITDAGLAHLAPLKNLTYLSLMGTAITDTGLEHLKALPKLKQLSVSDTGVTPLGITRLKAAMPTLRYAN